MAKLPEAIIADQSAVASLIDQHHAAMRERPLLHSATCYIEKFMYI